MKKFLFILSLLIACVSVSYGQSSVGDRTVNALRSGKDVTIMLAVNELVNPKTGELSDDKVLEITPGSQKRLTLEMEEDKLKVVMTAVKSSKDSENGLVIYHFIGNSNVIQYAFASKEITKTHPFIFLTLSGKMKTYIVNRLAVYGISGDDIINFPSVSGYNNMNKILNYLLTKYK